MKIEQIYTACLAQGAYYIQVGGEAAVIDPLREVASYLKKAKKNGAKIKYIFETHFHADFVSGHLTLHQKTGAPIIYGPNASPTFEVYIARDEEVFSLGNAKIKVLHTPGHTMESTTYLLIDENGKECAIFTGDTLFLGDVGRPDLAQKATHKTKEDLAGMLYESLRSKIMPLPDDLIVYPGHGAGSACGKNMMKETTDTLGHQKRVNYALKANMTRAAFIKELTTNLLPPPNYFPLNVQLNREGYEDINTVIDRGLKALTPAAFQELAAQERVIILDVRQTEEFIQSHIPNSLFIGLDGNFAPWVGAIIVDIKRPIILVAPDGREEEAIIRLARVGFDNTLGYLAGGISAWKSTGRPTASVEAISPETLTSKYEAVKTLLFDVRKENEYASEHIIDAKNTPLDNINGHLAAFPKKKTFYLHCAGGYRSVIAASILKSKGIHNLINVRKGFDVIRQLTIPTSSEVV